MVRLLKALWIVAVAVAAGVARAEFPYQVPEKQPEGPLSTAMKRAYEYPGAPIYWNNELSSLFRYTPIEGFDYNDSDGTISRRDPSKIVKANGKYYVWYTKRETKSPPRGAWRSTDTIPSSDWDLAEIWYATSKDGFRWKEQGVAVERPEKPHPGWRSVSTPDVLLWKGKYYLYYQAFLEASGKRGDNCPVSVSVADSPDGPWRHSHQLVVPNGPEGAWDQNSIHDPYPLVFHGKIYLYYKSDFNRPQTVRMQGLAIADDPLGPFEKHPLNPVLNSGHETGLFPFKEGIAAIAIRHGVERNTIQWAPDGVNFHPVSTVNLPPIAPGPYVPDAFTDTKDGEGITWGLCHFTGQGDDRGERHAIMARFDCDLSQAYHDPAMKRFEERWTLDTYFRTGFDDEERDRVMKRDREALRR